MKPEPKERLVEHLSHRGIVGLKTPKPTVRPEAQVPHLRRLADKVARRLTDEGFRVIRHVVEPVPSGFLLLWEHDPVVLPAQYEHRGPPAEDAVNSRKFLQKWQSHPDALNLPHPKEGRWSVTLRRVQRDPASVLGPALSELLKGTELTPRFARSAALQSGLEFLRSPGTRLALTKLLVPRDPWQS
jgi:tRNA nucleotidyltransferase (CCA-adding enzyme)